MNRAIVPWVLLVGVVALWFFGGRSAELEDDVARENARIADLERRIEDLRAQVGEQAGRAAPEPRPDPPPTVAPGLATDTGTQAEAARSRAAQAAGEARTALNLRAMGIMRGWLDAVRSLKTDPATRAATLAEIRASLDDEDDARRLAALRALRWLPDMDHDRSALRRDLAPHAISEDPTIRRAALEALAFVDPQPEDVSLWLPEARAADRSSAEVTAQALTRVAGGRIEGDAAEAVLALLREGTGIKKAFVMRGLQQATVFDPRVEARLIEIVRGAAPGDYDRHYFFHFLAPRMDPKSDAIVGLLLDAAADGRQTQLATVLRGFRGGLSEAQRRRVADALMAYAENAETVYTLGALVEALRLTASAGHVVRLEALLEKEEVRNALGPAIARAVEAARRRSD